MRRTGAQELGVVLSYNLWLLMGIAVLVVALHIQPSPSRLMLLYFVLANVIVMAVLRTIAKAAARTLLARCGFSVADLRGVGLPELDARV